MSLYPAIIPNAVGAGKSSLISALLGEMEKRRYCYWLLFNYGAAIYRFCFFYFSNATV